MAAWHELFPLDREPTMEDIAGYIDHPLWDAFTASSTKATARNRASSTADAAALRVGT